MKLARWILIISALFISVNAVEGTPNLKQCLNVNNQYILNSVLEDIRYDYYQNGNPVTIVVGNGAAASDTISATNIAGYLKGDLLIGFTSKLSSQITNLELTNNTIISLGGPCANSVSRILIRSNNSCTEGFHPEEGKIVFFEDKGRYRIVVAGYSAKDTKAIADLFISGIFNYSIDFSFSDDPEFILHTSNNSVLFRGCTNLTQKGSDLLDEMPNLVLKTVKNEYVHHPLVGENASLNVTNQGESDIYYIYSEKNPSVYQLVNYKWMKKDRTTPNQLYKAEDHVVKLKPNEPSIKLLFPLTP